MTKNTPRIATMYIYSAGAYPILPEHCTISKGKIYKVRNSYYIMEITKMSSKGQIVLPREIREELHLEEGTILVAVKKEGLVILKKIDNPILKEDLETIKLVEEAWEDIDKGRYKKMKSEDFLNEIKKW